MILTNKNDILDAIAANVVEPSSVSFRTFSGLELRTDWWEILSVVENYDHRNFELHRDTEGDWTLVEVPE